MFLSWKCWSIPSLRITIIYRKKCILVSQLKQLQMFTKMFLKKGSIALSVSVSQRQQNWLVTSRSSALTPYASLKMDTFASQKTQSDKCVCKEELLFTQLTKSSIHILLLNFLKHSGCLWSVGWKAGRRKTCSYYSFYSFQSYTAVLPLPHLTQLLHHFRTFFFFFLNGV